MCKAITIASKKLFSLNYHFFFFSPKNPLKVTWRFRALRPLGDLHGTSPGRRVPAGHGVSKKKTLSTTER